MKTPWVFDRCTLGRVIDGDSVAMDVDTGFNHRATVHVRLIGVDTPERGRNPEGWRLARDFVANWFNDSGRFSFSCVGQEKYGRWLGKISNNEGESLSDALIQSGYGVPYDGKKKP